MRIHHVHIPVHVADYLDPANTCVRHVCSRGKYFLVIDRDF